MIRFLLVVVMLAGTAGAVVAYGDPHQIARASDSVAKMLRHRSLEPPPAVQIARGKAGEFALHAKINGVKAPMVIDTGATSVVPCSDREPMMSATLDSSRRTSWAIGLRGYPCFVRRRAADRP